MREVKIVNDTGPKSKEENYNFEIYFLNNIYDCMDSVNTDLECLIESYGNYKEIIPSEIRTIIIELATAFELIIKFRLQTEHWSLIFADINKAEGSKIEDGNFISVDIESGILRLKNICELNYNFKYLRKICNYRNRLMHYTLRFTNMIEIINTIGNGILELSNFFETEIKELLPMESQDDFVEVIKHYKINCKNLNLIAMKIKYKKGSDKNVQSTKFDN